MKHKNRIWLYYLVAIVLMITIPLFLYYSGFRITYAPTLENNWEAIAAVATWVGVFASFAAIWFAITVPKEIAAQQNNISLLEKRSVCYQVLQKHAAFLDCFEEENQYEAIFRAFALAFSNNLTEDVEDLDLLSLKIESQKAFLLMPALYASISFDEASRLFQCFSNFIDEIEVCCTAYDIDKTIFVEYFNSVENFQRNHLNMIRNSLKI